jgi:hypothetical protein
MHNPITRIRSVYRFLVKRKEVHKIGMWIEEVQGESSEYLEKTHNVQRGRNKSSSWNAREIVVANGSLSLPDETSEWERPTRRAKVSVGKEEWGEARGYEEDLRGNIAKPFFSLFTYVFFSNFSSFCGKRHIAKHLQSAAIFRW